MLTWIAFGCQPTADPIRVADPPPDPTPTTIGPTNEPVGTPCAGVPAPLENAVDLSADLGSCIVTVVPDLGGDGADDIVGRLARLTSTPAGSTRTTGFAIHPDVLGAAQGVVLRSPASVYSDLSGRLNVGLEALLWTEDATGDGHPDLWLQDVQFRLSLVPGPITQPLEDPATTRVGYLDAFADLATDLDRDGTADLITSAGRAVNRCEGPFSGEITPGSCPEVTFALWYTADALDDGDLDGDGLDEVLVSTEDRQLGYGVYRQEAELTAVDGDWTGADGGQFSITPEWSPWFSKGEAQLTDLDGDGYADVVWRDEPTWSPAPGLGEIAVVHGPISAGASLHLADATLHLIGAGDGAGIAGTADVDGDGVPGLLLEPEGGSVLLVDASVRGTVDPATGSIAFSTGTVAGVGDFDADGRDDIVLQDNSAGGVWLFLGASL